VYDGTYWVEVGTAPIGPIGVQGIQGLQGTQGLQGRQGTQGLQGIQGIQGIQGTQGLLGNQGIQGLSFQGIQGFTVQGIQGTQGLQGLQGRQGIQGLQGFGFAQAQGTQGTQGTQGLLGNQGTQGVQGTIGIQGTQGTQGTTGTQGTQGITGAQGLTGLQGVQGLQGIQGDTGTQGLLGVQGFTGLQGIQGIQGITGLQGLLGIQGAIGLQGTFGDTGTQGIQGPSAATTPTDTVVTGKLSSDQTIASATNDVLISFVDDFDPQNWWDATAKQFKPTIPGYYSIALHAWWTAAGATTNQYNIQIRKNGNTSAIFQNQTVTGSGSSQGGSRIIYLNGSTDYVDFTAYNGDTVTRSLQWGGGGQGTWFSAALMTTGVGVDGATGAQGLQGLQGIGGLQGLQGFGFAQAQGTTGAQGIQGFTGTMSSTYQTTEPLSGSNGDIWIDSDSDALYNFTPVLATLNRWRKTVSGGQTSLTGADDNSMTLAYTPGEEQVFLNGVLLVRGQDYTGADGVTIGGLLALAANDVVEVHSRVLQGVADTYTQAQADARYVNKSVGGLNLVIPTGATGGTVGANGAVTIGSAVSSVNVTGAFSSAYDVYKIIISGGVASGAPDLQLSLDGITTGYYSTLTYQNFGSTTVIGAQASNAARWSWTGAGTTSGLNMNVELHSPNLAKPKTASNFYNEMGISATNGLSRQFNASTTQATGFTITPSTGTLTGGTIRIYGYNNGA
jgi:hypothetical protein